MFSVNERFLFPMVFFMTFSFPWLTLLCERSMNTRPDKRASLGCSCDRPGFRSAIGHLLVARFWGSRALHLDFRLGVKPAPLTHVQGHLHAQCRTGEQYKPRGSRVFRPEWRWGAGSCCAEVRLGPDGAQATWPRRQVAPSPPELPLWGTENTGPFWRRHSRITRSK